MNLDPRLLAEFERQIGVELGNSVAYLAAYAWCRANGFEGFSKRWKNFSKEEHDHAQNFVKYCARSDDVAKFAPDQIAIPEELNVVAITEFALALEEQTELGMRAVIKVAEEVGDADAVEYVSGKLIDQKKDSKKARDFLKYVKLVAQEPGDLALFDRKLENNRY